MGTARGSREASSHHRASCPRSCEPGLEDACPGALILPGAHHIPASRHSPGPSLPLHPFVSSVLKCYLFICFGWSSCCIRVFQLWLAGAPSSHTGFSLQRLLLSQSMGSGAHWLSRLQPAGLLTGHGDLPRPRIKPVCPALRVGPNHWLIREALYCSILDDSTREGMDILLCKCPDGKREARAYLSRALQAL